MLPCSLRSCGSSAGVALSLEEDWGLRRSASPLQQLTVEAMKQRPNQLHDPQCSLRPVGTVPGSSTFGRTPMTLSSNQRAYCGPAAKVFQMLPSDCYAWSATFDITHSRAPQGFRRHDMIPHGQDDHVRGRMRFQPLHTNQVSSIFSSDWSRSFDESDDCWARFARLDGIATQHHRPAYRR